MIPGSSGIAHLPLIAPLIKTWNFGVGTFQRHPFLVKTVTSGIGFAVGDSLTQLAIRREGEPYDWPRTAAMGAAGLTVAGPVGYLFIIWMESNIMPTAAASRLAITTKVTLDQVLGCIMWQSALMAINEPYRESAVNLCKKVGENFKKEDKQPKEVKGKKKPTRR